MAGGHRRTRSTSEDPDETLRLESGAPTALASQTPLAAALVPPRQGGAPHSARPAPSPAEGRDRNKGKSVAPSDGASSSEAARARRRPSASQAPPRAVTPEPAAGARRHLEFGDSTPAQTLQMAQYLLRHPPVDIQGDSPAAPWLRDVAAIVDAARQQGVSGVSGSPSSRGPAPSPGAGTGRRARSRRTSPPPAHSKAGSSGARRPSAAPAPSPNQHRRAHRRRGRTSERPWSGDASFAAPPPRRRAPTLRARPQGQACPRSR